MFYGNSIITISKERIFKGIVIAVATKNDFELISNILKGRLILFKKVYNSFFNVFEFLNKAVIYVVGPFIGSSYSSMIVEMLKKCKVFKIIFIGWCGSISNDLTEGDIFIPYGSFTDEGLSNSYINRIRLLTHPSKKLKYKLHNISKKKGVFINTGLIWTTDAVFRETINKINYLKNKGIVAVDMETSAIFNLCNLYNIKIISMLVVSDLIRGNKWIPKYNTDLFNKGRYTLSKLAIALSLECYEYRKKSFNK